MKGGFMSGMKKAEHVSFSEQEVRDIRQYIYDLFRTEMEEVGGGLTLKEGFKRGKPYTPSLQTIYHPMKQLKRPQDRTYVTIEGKADQWRPVLLACPKGNLSIGLEVVTHRMWFKLMQVHVDGFGYGTKIGKRVTESLALDMCSMESVADLLAHHSPYISHLGSVIPPDADGLNFTWNYMRLTASKNETLFNGPDLAVSSQITTFGKAIVRLLNLKPDDRRLNQMNDWLQTKLAAYDSSKDTLTFVTGPAMLDEYVSAHSYAHSCMTAPEKRSDRVQATKLYTLSPEAVAFVSISAPGKGKFARALVWTTEENGKPVWVVDRVYPADTNKGARFMLAIQREANKQGIAKVYNRSCANWPPVRINISTEIPSLPYMDTYMYGVVIEDGSEAIIFTNLNQIAAWKKSQRKLPTSEQIWVASEEISIRNLTGRHLEELTINPRKGKAAPVKA